MKMTTGGRVTIPVHIRRLAGLQPGDELECAVDGDVVTIIPAPKGQPQTKRASRRSVRVPAVCMTTEEIMALSGDDVV